MKKIIVTIFCLVILTGCGIGKNYTPKDLLSNNEQTSQLSEVQETPPQTDNNEIIEEREIDLDSIIEYFVAENFLPPEGFDEKLEGVEYGELTEVEYYSETTSAARKCYVYTPPNYDPTKTYPVLYLLHGIGGTHSEWIGGAPNEIISNLIADGEAVPMIAVMPNVRAKQDDSLQGDMLGQENISAFDNFINDLRNDLMPFIEENYPVSQKRQDCAVAGLSMGGRESIFIGVSMPETFGYIGAFSPAPGLLPFSELSYSGQLKADEMLLPDEYKDNTLIFINNGNQDGVVNDIPFQYSEAFKDNGIKHVYYTIDGGHDFGVWRNGLYYFVKSIF